MSTSDCPWRTVTGGVIVRVRVTPKSSKDTIEGIEQTADGAALKARVRAVPSEGEANTAVQQLLAKWVGVPRSSVSLAGGAKSRVKLLTVAGDPVVLEETLARTLVQGGTRKPD